MSEITAIQIQKRNKDKVNIFLDDEFCCALTVITVLSERLKVGDELDEQRLQSLLYDSECQLAFDRAISLLSRSFKTKKQMKDFLTQKGYDVRVVEATMEKLCYYKYLDDQEFAKTYVDGTKHKKGTRGIKFDLQTKGVDEATIEGALQSIEQDEMSEGCAEVARKFMKNKTVDQKSIQALYRHLQYRGYDFDLISQVVKEFCQNFDD